MLVEKEEYIIKGSNALKQSAIEVQRENEYEKLREQRVRSKQKAKKNLVRLRLSILLSIGMVLFTGILLVFRYSMIYSLQDQYFDAKDELGVVERYNEKLKIDLLKVAEEKDVLNTAKESHNMVLPQKGTAIVLEGNEKTFAEPTKVDEKENLFDKIKGLF